MKPLIPFWSSVIIALISFASFALVGCHTSTVSDGSPDRSTQSPTPAQVSSSADVVKGVLPDVSVNAGQSVNAAIKLSIKPGFHVNANPPTFSYLIPTEVTAAKVEGVTVGKPVYPAAVKRKFQFADQPLAVYEGEALVTLPLSVAAGAAKGPRSLPIKLRIQACDEQQCFPPSTLNTTLQIEVK
jgi:DsbC/DsbD-like thiol-disulfide interchange protein